MAQLVCSKSVVAYLSTQRSKQDNWKAHIVFKIHFNSPASQGSVVNSNMYRNL